MKNLLTKSIILVFIVSLLFSFAACGKDKLDTTTGIPTTTEEFMTEVTTEYVAVSEPLAFEIIEIALNSAGDSSWDGDVASLTDEQKRVISEYFTTPGTEVEFRDGNIYLVQTSDESTTASDEQPTGSDVVSNTNTPAQGVNKTPKPARKPTPKPAPKPPIKLPGGGSTSEMPKSKSGSVMSYKYDPVGKFFYCEEDPWQREFGFNDLYDPAANFTFMFYDTVRIRFQHGGKDWMIQLWMGQYGLTFIGGEIGIYTRELYDLEAKELNHYDCASDEDAMMMEMALYSKGKHLFTRKEAKFWWITGFVGGSLDNYHDRSQLTMLAKITLKDAAMRDLFVKGLQAHGFTTGYTGLSTENTYKLAGESTVYINWKGEDKADKEIKIKFNLVNGKGDTTPLLMKKGETIHEYMMPTVQREGYKFLGWTKLGSSKTVEFPQTVGSSDTTYYAKWSDSPNYYMVTFDNNGGVGHAAPVRQQYNTPVELPKDGFTKESQTFIGWNTTKEAETALSGSYRVPGKNITLYAVYIDN